MNTIQPGETIVADYQPREIRAIPGKEVGIAVTLAPTDTDLLSGTVLGFITASGLAKPYDNAATDGSEVAVCILAENIPKSAGNTVTSAYIGGIFQADKLIGFDANAKTVLAAREVRDMVIIPT